MCCLNRHCDLQKGIYVLFQLSIPNRTAVSSNRFDKTISGSSNSELRYQNK